LCEVWHTHKSRRSGVPELRAQTASGAPPRRRRASTGDGTATDAHRAAAGRTARGLPAGTTSRQATPGNSARRISAAGAASRGLRAVSSSRGLSAAGAAARRRSPGQYYAPGDAGQIPYSAPGDALGYRPGPQPPAGRPGGSRRTTNIIIVAVILTVVVVGASAGAYFVLNKKGLAGRSRPFMTISARYAAATRQGSRACMRPARSPTTRPLPR